MQHEKNKNLMILHDLARDNMQKSVLLAIKMGEMLNQAKHDLEINGIYPKKSLNNDLNDIHYQAMFAKSEAETSALKALSLDSSCFWAKQVISGLGQLFGESETVQ